jgi:hypothetical protein
VTKHVVLWTLKETVGGKSPEENAREVKSRIEALKARIPEIIMIEVGIGFGRGDGSADVVLYSEFRDQQALEAYRTHPDHVEAAAFILSVAERLAIIDYEV